MARTTTTPWAQWGPGARIRAIGTLLVLATLFLSAWGPLTGVAPTEQDIQIAGRVLHFQEPPFSGEIVVAIVYDRLQPASLAEAKALSELLGSSLPVGNLRLSPRLVEQNQLAGTGSYEAIFETVGVSDQLLSAAMRSHPVLCLTRHLEQVEHGVCVVAICSEPQVVIVVNEMNAGTFGLRFATVFRMMVQEI